MDDPNFVVICADCEMDCRIDDLSGAIDFAVNHQRHTGHDLSWERCRFADGIIAIPERTRFRVRCTDCDTERLFEDRERAEAFCEDHERYAGHAVDELAEVSYPALSEIGPEELQAMLDYYFEHAEATETVPTEAIVTAFEERGLSRERAAAAQRENDAMHLGDGLLTR